MTSERHFYKHAETGIVSEITDRAAAVFGDRLVRIEPETPEPEKTEPESTTPKPRASKKVVEEESPKEES